MELSEKNFCGFYAKILHFLGLPGKYDMDTVYRTALKWKVFVTLTSVEQVFMLEIQTLYDVFYITDICAKNCDNLIEREWAEEHWGWISTDWFPKASLYFFLITVIDFKLKIHRMSDDLSHQITSQSILSMLTCPTSLHISCHTLLTCTV